MSLKKFNFLILLFCLLLSSCDFTSGLHQSILRAQDFIKKQEFSNAADEYESILKLKLSQNLRIKINFQLGEIYSLYLNKNKEALKNFKNVIEITDNPIWQVKSLERYAQINFEFIKDYKESLTAYETLINFTPTLEKQDFYEFRYAQSLLNLNKYDQAIKYFEDMIKKTNHEYYIKAYYEIGLCYYYLKKWPSAIKYFKDYIGRETSKDGIVMAKFLIANAYETSEQLKKAYNIYYSILNSYPNPDVIKNRLESLYQRRVARKR